MPEDLDITIAMMNFHLSITTDEEGNQHIGIAKMPPTRRVLIEKYIVKLVEIEVLGRTEWGKKSIYEEPYSNDDDD